VICAFETGFLDDAPELEDPVRAFKAISQDTQECEWQIKLKTGEKTDAVAILRYYIEAIERMQEDTGEVFVFITPRFTLFRPSVTVRFATLFLCTNTSFFSAVPASFVAIKAYISDALSYARRYGRRKQMGRDRAESFKEVDR